MSSKVGDSSDDPKPQFQFPDVIELNVGGRIFETTLMTLTKHNDTMLAAMFSGKHPQPQDKNGRYFIDADGDTFVYILRYLRHKQLPPKDMIEEVYRAAQYFGPQDLLDELEGMPQIALKKIREGFSHANYGDMDKTIRTIMKQAINISEVTNIVPNIFILISVQHKDRQNVERDENHVCAFSGLPDFGKGRVAWHNRKADVTVGTLTSPYITEEMYMDALVKEMVTRGYCVQHKKAGNCTEGFTQQKTEGRYCGAQLFRLQLRWQ